MKTTQLVLLSAVTATGASAALDVSQMNMLTFYITAASVTTGGTLALEAQTPSGAWVAIDTRNITANGDQIVTVTGAFSQVRANLTARTDGTYTVQVYGKK